MTQHQSIVLSQVAEALPPIPPLITTRIGFKVDTTGAGWQMPTQFNGYFVNWETYPAGPEILPVVQGYVAFLLENRSEATAIGTVKSLQYVDWKILTEPWIQNGEITLSDVIASRAELEDRLPGVGRKYWGNVRRLYAWAAEMGVPGFSEQVAFRLSHFKSRKRPTLESQSRVAPGVGTSHVSKNRRKYDDITTANIEAALLKAIRNIRSGVADPRIKLSGIVLTYLALDHGQRPLSLAKMRESHFEVRETEGAICYWLEVPNTKGMRQKDYIYATRLKQLSATWGGLIEDLIAHNRAHRENLGLDNTLDWPLFPIVQTGAGSKEAKRARLPHPDPSMQLHSASRGLDFKLKRLFAALRISDSEGKVIVPTFYSFRDTFASNLARAGAPLTVRAYELGHTTTQSTPVYDKRGPEFAAMLDQSFLRERLAAIAEPFIHGAKFSESKDEGAEVPFIDPDTGLFLGATGRCGCPGTRCGLSGSIECYLCGNFRAMAEGPHARILDFMLDRRAHMQAEGKPENQFTRYDIHIFVVQEILRRIDRMHAGECV